MGKEKRINFSVSVDILFGAMKILWNKVEIVIILHMNVLNANELYTLKCLILFYMSSTSIIKKKYLYYTPFMKEKREDNKI